MHKQKAEISENPAKRLKPAYAIIPVILGLGVTGYLLYNEFNPSAFDAINFTWLSVFWLLVAAILMIGRDIGYSLRLMVLSEGKFRFWKALRVIMLWEFTSAITPSAIGGTSVAIIYVNKEGLNLGNSSALVMITSFLDEIYFVAMFPLLILFAGYHNLFEISSVPGAAKELITFSIVGYSLKFLWVLALIYGLFFNPRGLKWLILLIFKLPILRRWKHGANRAGTDIISSSKVYRNKPLSFWVKAFLFTFLSWSSRFFVVNAILMAFFGVGNNLLIFARQLVMWIMMLVSPTPGGSGFAEFVFTRYLSEFIPVDASLLVSVAVAMAFLWRLISYYPYLVVGSFIFPRWINRHFVRKT
ncbi:lysylphosphatidylglycerol synthase transmembrane domain-containing protein [Tenuifilum thalassicum]|uniref:Flippase-like domain-containing protein n=1 Tax=Tenuifilum thalassicum TaxID=2590900 RepID=A0A7D3XY84_9BACT|nr:lysylphosphatidylglycerol synthase transmembrane domain-containing protein [Tenuifilum thalassicum]QKG78953.1 flippase-like domain-containing protein [Tenuifilum thalassicum]